MNINKYQKVCLWFVLLVLLFWNVLFLTRTQSGFFNYLYSFLFGLTPLIGGIVAIRKSSLWGGWKSSLGKAVLLIGIGIFCWGAGEMIWSYYNFFTGVAAPYPSLADIGFAPSIFFYGIGVIYLSRVTGAKFGLRNPAARLFVTLMPFVILALSYYLLIVVARGGVIVPDGETALKAFLDIVYPLGDFVSVVVAVIISGLSFRYLGGLYRYDIIALLLGLVMMFIADTIFSYTTTIGTYYNANFGDLMLTLGTALLTFGVLGFCTLKNRET